MDSLFLEYITLSKVKEILNLKDFRSVKNWCDKNQIFIFKLGKRTNYKISKSDFLITLHKPFINHLKNLNPHNWKELFQAYLDKNISLIIELKSKQSMVTNYALSYKATNNSEISFLEKLNKL